MKTLKHGLLGLMAGTLAFASVGLASDHEDQHDHVASHRYGGPLVEAVRAATRDFQNVLLAESAGYTSMGACVSSGGDEGAMGVHYVNFGDLQNGNELDASQPEALMFEQRNGRLRLLGVEYILFASEWDAAHPDGMAPALMGQLFNYVGAPNRYRLPPVYVLHVWAWKDSPNGTFSNWNPRVSCNSYAGEMTH